ncbi:MAG: hypothetical protein LBK99_01915 [Opitutaceae bacterium]|jgi:hypothetical protein|nr:hypothetical protein [Opitutaceae bacterium]
MSDYLWQLPGPRIFIQRAIEHIQQGYSLFLETARSADPPGTTLRDRLVEKLRETGMDATPIIPDETITPLDTLRREGLLPNDEPFPDYDLCVHLGHQCLIVDNRLAVDCPWATLVRRLRHLIRQQPVNRQTSFVVICSPRTKAAGPHEDVLLKTLQWDHAITHADILALAESLWIQPSSNSLVRTMFVHVAAHLCGKEIPLLEHLSQATPETLLQTPLSLLTAWAHQSGWTLDGGLGSMLHARLPPAKHPLRLALENNEPAIRQLVWQAQVEVLFPWVEEQRTVLIKDLLRFLPSWHEGTQATDLEIGQIWHLIRSNSNVPYILRRKISGLREIRNMLAHRRPVSGRTLLSYLSA